MNEEDYIKVTNLANMRTISNALKEVMAGDSYGVDKDTYSQACDLIATMQQKLFNEIEITT